MSPGCAVGEPVIPLQAPLVVVEAHRLLEFYERYEPLDAIIPHLGRIPCVDLEECGHYVMPN